MNFQQCKLKKENTFQVAFIPSKFAKVNKMLKIKENDIWTDGWKVFEVYSTIVAEEMLPDSHKIIKAHRDKTGDSLPKER